MSTDTTSDNWTKAELIAASPQDSTLVQIGDETRTMSNDEYEAWVESMIGQPKTIPTVLDA